VNDIDEFLKPYAKKYKVPYKNGEDLPEEYVLRLSKSSLNDLAFENVSNMIKNNFADHKKSVGDSDVEQKIENTIKFLASFLEKK